jgi:uncharacterized protein involved in exopolysaccharide biosynthesis
MMEHDTHPHLTLLLVIAIAMGAMLGAATVLLPGVGV